MATYRLPVLMSTLVILSGSFACSREGFSPPHATDITQSPLSANGDTLLTEFKLDAEKAFAVYQGKRLYFKNITVSTCKPATRNDPDAYFVSNGVIFKPRYASDLDVVVEGTELDVVGEVRGYMAGVLVIGECWIKITGGSTGTATGGY